MGRCFDDAELACAYVIGRVRERAGARWRQGAWREPLVADAPRLPESVRVVAEHRLHRVERCVARGLVEWACGRRPVALLDRVPSPREVLAHQARGGRCVSLLEDDALAAPHADGLAFCLHDLCHLEKFMEPEHHVAQVGFFALVLRAMEDPRWTALERDFDDAWRSDRDHVVSDMNGSPIFLFAALKMKLKMAVRRKLASERGAPAPTGGPLDETESRAFDAAVDALLDVLGLDGDARDAALAVSTRRDTPAHAMRLVTRFEREATRRPRPRALEGSPSSAA